MDTEKRLAKNERIRLSGAATRERRKAQECHVRVVKVQANKLNATQREHLFMLFVEAKWVYNHIVQLSREGVDVFSLDYKTLRKVIRRDKDGNEIETLITRLSSQMLQAVLESYKQNVRGLAGRKAAGLPIGQLRFVSEYTSINLQQSGVTYSLVGNDRIKIQGLKKPVKVNGLRQLAGLSGAFDLANARLLLRPSGVYVALTVWIEKQPPAPTPGGKIGIDLGCSTSVTLSDGRKLNASVPEGARLKKLQRRLSRCEKGSSNRRRIIRLIKAEYEKITNRKDDAARKLAHELSAHEVVMQDEQVAKWQRSGHGKAVQHGVLFRLKSLLVSDPSTVVLPKWLPTTRLCRRCGHEHKELRLRDRTFVCPVCGAEEDRDVHAAQNMLWLSEKIIGVGRTEFTPADFEALLRESFGGMMQEAAKSSA